MFIAMNRFKVAKDTADKFEDLWTKRDSFLHETPGFKAFHLLRGPEKDDHILYTSHSMWESYAAFEAWTKSEHFRKAHANAGDTSVRDLYLGPPEFEGFHVIQEVTAEGASRIINQTAAE